MCPAEAGFGQAGAASPVHIDVRYLPQMAGEDRRGYLFVAIELATRWVYRALKLGERAGSVHTFLNAQDLAASRARCALTISVSARTRNRPSTGTSRSTTTTCPSAP